MKKVLEEAFLTIEQMGYGIIDPVLADWKAAQTSPQQQTNLSDPIIHGKHSPVLIDDVWLQEYESYAGELPSRTRQKQNWDDLFREIEEMVKTEGIWADKDANLSPLQIGAEQTAQLKKVNPSYSSGDIFSEFKGWPDRTVDILSSDELINKQTESIVIELPLKIYNQQNHLVLEAELPGLIKSAAAQNADLKSMLTSQATGTDGCRVRTSVVNGELRMELGRG